MPIIAQGAAGTLDAIVSDGLGDAADWDAAPAPTVTVQTLLGVVQTGFPASPLVHDGLGWIAGTGRVGATTGDGNADIYVVADGVHPSVAGAAYLGTRLAFAISPPSTGLVGG